MSLLYGLGSMRHFGPFYLLLKSSQRLKMKNLQFTNNHLVQLSCRAQPCSPQPPCESSSVLFLLLGEAAAEAERFTAKELLKPQSQDPSASLEETKQSYDPGHLCRTQGVLKDEEDALQTLNLDQWSSGSLETTVGWRWPSTPSEVLLEDVVINNAAFKHVDLLFNLFSSGTLLMVP